MAEAWDRETPWRQGHLLSDDTFAKLFPEKKSAGFATAIIISHDCDLASDIEDEPTVELLLCRFIFKVDGNFSASKNSRRLQIPLRYADDKTVLDIVAVDRVQISKLQLLDETHNEKLTLTREEQRILQLWLSDRYARSSYSNAFNDLLKNKIKAKLPKIIEPLGPTLEALYFDVDDNEDIVQTNGDPPFELSIYLRYTQSDVEEGYKDTEGAAVAITALFKETFYDDRNRVWRGIELKLCIAISANSMTMATHQNLRLWDTAYLSLRAKPQQNVAKR